MHLLRNLSIFGLLLTTLCKAEEVPLTPEQWHLLRDGKSVLLAGDHPCPLSSKKKFVTGAVLIDHGIDAVWTVLSDAESAPTYIDDLISARIISEQADSMLVEQGMKVEGLRKTFHYHVRIFPTTQEKLIFEMEKGKMRDFRGGWWLYPKGAQTLLVYSLYLDVGFLAPQALVRNSLKKKIPQTLEAVKGEVARRSSH